MGAWYVFACIGLYPEIPGIGGFTINTPIFESVTLNLKKRFDHQKADLKKYIYTVS